MRLPAPGGRVALFYVLHLKLETGFKVLTSMGFALGPDTSPHGLQGSHEASCEPPRRHQRQTSQWETNILTAGSMKAAPSSLLDNA